MVICPQGWYFNPLPPCGGRQLTYRATFVPPDFNPLPPCGGRQVERADQLYRAPFQSTPSVWRETFDVKIYNFCDDNFNPLPPCGGRLSDLRKSGLRSYFNPLPPCGGRRAPAAKTREGCRFQSTPSVWRETTECMGMHYLFRFQSTPSVWRETNNVQTPPPQRAISIHSLRVEGDRSQPTRESGKKQNFNPLPPCGGRPYPACCGLACTLISIHSLRVEGDRLRR